MKKVLLFALLAFAFLVPASANAEFICKLKDGGNVEIKNEYKSGDRYVVTVLNDSEVNANVFLTITYKVGKETKTARNGEVVRALDSTKIEIPCDENATDIKITEMKGTKCQ